jgi:hypothetical protein
VLAPFVLASCLAVLPLAVPSAPPEETAGFSGPLVTEADYDAHVQYQMNFSRRSLHVPPLGQADTGFQENSYFRYTIGEDGLVAGQYTAPDTPDIPPFPLADLNAFLSAGSPAPSKAGIVEWGDLLPALLVFILTLPLFIAARRGKRGRKRIPAYYDKRIAA